MSSPSAAALQPKPRRLVGGREREESVAMETVLVTGASRGVGLQLMGYAAWMHAFEVNTLAPFRVTDRSGRFWTWTGDEHPW